MVLNFGVSVLRTADTVSLEREMGGRFAASAAAVPEVDFS
jgi:hypothetical protein